MSGGS